MKASLLLFAAATSAFAAKPILVRIDDQTLAKRQQADPMTRLEQPAPGEAVVNRPGKESIIGQSTVLHDGTHWTLVPKGAVLHQPEGLGSKVNSKPVGTLLAWADFLRTNHAWITTNEVSFEQAAGNESIPAGRVAFWAKQDKLVIAVHQNGPISVQVAQSPNLTSR